MSFCNNCGTKLHGNKICTSCGTNNHNFTNRHKTKARIHLIWAMTLLILVGISIAIYIYNDSKTIASKSMNGISKLLHDISTDSMMISFSNYNTTIKGVSKFQVAELTQMALLTNHQNGSLINLYKDADVEITVPVEYTYTVSFSEPWSITVDSSNVITVNIIAPKIRPNTPAPNISQLKEQKINSNFLNNGNKAMNQLKNEITPRLKITAIDNVPLIREIARKRINDYFRKWLVNSYSLYNVPIIVTVKFIDEISTNSVLEPLNNKK